jgi:hypothetical protein
LKFNVTYKPLKVLDLDIENRPLSYWYDGNPTAEITAIAWSWCGTDVVKCMLLQPDDLQGSTLKMLEAFYSAYQKADIVTGHYIRRHDLPIINGALLENKLPLLTPKLTHDTKNDLVRRDGLSMSQEALGAMYALDAPKYHMTQQAWRDANRLTPAGLRLTRRRVSDDVRQHKELYRVLQLHGALKPPRTWRP